MKFGTLDREKFLRGERMGRNFKVDSLGELIEELKKIKPNAEVEVRPYVIDSLNGYDGLASLTNEKIEINIFKHPV